MAEKRKSKSKKQEVEGEQPSKEEYAVAKHLRFTVPVKEGRLVGMTVIYFTGSEAVNCLLDSKWAKTKDGLFTTRSSCVSYCNSLLCKGLFHRAEKVQRKKKKNPEEEVVDTNGEEEGKKSKKEKRSKKEKGKDNDKDKKDKDQKEKKIKLDMHPQQEFVDGEELYVWIYDPVNSKTFIIGLLMVLGAIAVCLFPLWPPEVRVGVYYVSLGAAGLIGLLLALIVVKVILFAAIWVGTFGKHSFWLFPNLTEDVGFFESFVPVYSYEVKDSSDKTDSAKKDKKGESKKKLGKKGKGDSPNEESADGQSGNDSEAGLKEKSEEVAQKEKEYETNDGFEVIDKPEGDC